jgi:hypothetical protein
LFLTNKCSTFTFVIKNNYYYQQLKTYTIMEKVSKLAILFNKMQDKNSVLIPMNLVRDFSVFCKMAEVKTEAEIYTDKMLFTLIK